MIGIEFSVEVERKITKMKGGRKAVFLVVDGGTAGRNSGIICPVSSAPPQAFVSRELLVVVVTGCRRLGGFAGELFQPCDRDLLIVR